MFLSVHFRAAATRVAGTDAPVKDRLFWKRPKVEVAISRQQMDCIERTLARFALGAAPRSGALKSDFPDEFFSIYKTQLDHEIINM